MSKGGIALLSLFNKIDRSTKRLTTGRIHYFDTCPPEEDSTFIHAKAWFDIYPPPEDSLFYSFFFDFIGRFSSRRLG
jgi:hypothetical protein